MLQMHAHTLCICGTHAWHVSLLRSFRWRFQRYETFIFPKYTLNPNICIYAPLICVKYIRKHGIGIMCLCRTLRVPQFPYPSNKPIQDKPRPSAPWPARRCRWSERKRWSCCYLLLWGKGFVSLVNRIKPLRCLEKPQQWKTWICESVPYLLGHAIGSVFWCFLIIMKWVWVVNGCFLLTFLEFVEDHGRKHLFSSVLGCPWETGQHVYPWCIHVQCPMV